MSVGWFDFVFYLVNLGVKRKFGMSYIVRMFWGRRYSGSIEIIRVLSRGRLGEVKKNRLVLGDRLF